MTLRITLVSQEKEDFIVELKIDADSTFADLHRLILRHCGYDEMHGQRFFICDENWKPTQRILLGDEENVNIDEDVYLMSDSNLGDFLEDEGQRLTYRFDPEDRRMFLMEVTETTFSDRVPDGGIVTRSKGKAPAQILVDEETISQTASQIESEELEEEFYGEDGFEEEDLDMEGFDILE